MKLVVFGDSFVEGLIKEPVLNSTEERTNISFVNQLTYLDNPFTASKNMGRRGASNRLIANRVWKEVQLIENTKNVFYLVCWSGPWRGFDVKETDKKHKPYLDFPNFHFETDMVILFIKSLLESLNIPFLQTNSFAPLENKLPIDIYKSANYLFAEYKRNTLFDIIADRFLKEESLNSKDYYKNHNNFDIPKSNLVADCKHPSPLGHKKIAETLNLHIKEYIR